MRFIAGHSARVVLPSAGGSTAGSVAEVVLDWQFYAHTLTASATPQRAGDSVAVRLRLCNADAQPQRSGDAAAVRLRMCRADGRPTRSGDSISSLILNFLPSISVGGRVGWNAAMNVLSASRDDFRKAGVERVATLQAAAKADGCAVGSRIVLPFVASSTVAVRNGASRASPAIASMRASSRISAAMGQSSQMVMQPATLAARQVLVRMGASGQALVVSRFLACRGHVATISASSFSGASRYVIRKLDIRWGRSRPPAGIRPIRPGEPLPPPHWGGGGPGVPWILPIKGSYSMFNTAYVKRVDDNSAIEFRRVNIESDEESISRRFLADVFYEDLAKVSIENGPVDIEIGANGVVWRAVINRVREHQQFNADTVSISGLSRSYVLGDKYAVKRTATNATDAFLSGLASAELEPYGWQMLWDESLADELVPAGIYSIIRLSPASAVKRIVEAVGGFVSSHRTGLALVARKRFPKLPWEMDSAVADLSFERGAIQVMDLDWEDPPFINGVFVAGGRVGKQTLIRRAGSDGAIQGDMIVDDLLTTTTANVARGSAVLADAVPRKRVSIAMDVYSENGVAEPGQIIEVGGPYSWKGICRGSAVSIERGADDALIVRQTISVERYFNAQ